MRLGFWSVYLKHVQANYVHEQGLKNDTNQWAVASQLAVWRYVNGNWKYRNGRFHGTNINKKQRVYCERMRREVQKVLDSAPVVGKSGRHLMEAARTILTQPYRQQKAWISSVNVEVAKEKKRVAEQWRTETTQRRLEVLRQIRERGGRIARRVQQNVYRYFCLPEYLK